MPRPQPQPADRPRIQKVNEQHPVEVRATGAAPAPEPATPATAVPPPPAAPAVDEPAQMRPLSTRTTDEIHDRIRLEAFRTRKSVQQIINEALDAHLPSLPPT